MNDFPKQLRKADDVRLLATYCRYLQEKAFAEYDLNMEAQKCALLADLLDWVCGLEHEGVQELFKLAQKPLNKILAEKEFRDLEMSKACWLLRDQSLQAIKKQKQ